MTEHPMIREATRRAEQLQRGHDTYTGGPKVFHHNGHKREAAYPWLSDVEMAGEVRMLMRDDLAHEAIVCAARDRILHLSEELAREREKFTMHTAQVGAWLSALSDEFGIATAGETLDVATACSKIMDRARDLSATAKS